MKPKYFRAFEKVIQFVFTVAYEPSELVEFIDELQIYLVYTVTNAKNAFLRRVLFGNRYGIIFRVSSSSLGVTILCMMFWFR